MEITKEEVDLILEWLGCAQGDGYELRSEEEAALVRRLGQAASVSSSSIASYALEDYRLIKEQRKKGG